MATLTIRNLPESTRQALKERAAAHNVSMEAEVREIIANAIADDVDFIAGWIRETTLLRGDFQAPQRSLARKTDLS